MDTKTIFIYGFAVFFAIIKIALTAESKVGKYFSYIITVNFLV